MLKDILYYITTKMLRSALGIRLSPRQVYSQDYLMSPRWLVLRWLAKARDGWACRRCGRRRHLQVHHASYAHRGEPGLLGLFWEWLDLETLCNECHRAQHNR